MEGPGKRVIKMIELIVLIKSDEGQFNMELIKLIVQNKFGIKFTEAKFKFY